MITLEKCRTILAEGTEQMTDEELAVVRDFLYQTSKITFEIYKQTEDEDGVSI